MLAPPSNVSGAASPSQAPEGGGSTKESDEASSAVVGEDLKIFARGTYLPSEGGASWRPLHVYGVCRDGTVINILDKRSEGYFAAAAPETDIPAAASTPDSSGSSSADSSAVGANNDEEGESLFNLPSNTYLAWIGVGVAVGVAVGALVIRIRSGSGGLGASSASGSGRLLLNMAKADVAAHPSARRVLGEPVKCKDYFIFHGADHPANARISKLSAAFQFEASGPAATGTVDVYVRDQPPLHRDVCMFFFRCYDLFCCVMAAEPRTHVCSFIALLVGCVQTDQWFKTQMEHGGTSSSCWMLSRKTVHQRRST